MCDSVRVGLMGAVWCVKKSRDGVERFNPHTHATYAKCLVKPVYCIWLDLDLD